MTRAVSLGTTSQSLFVKDATVGDGKTELLQCPTKARAGDSPQELVAEFAEDEVPGPQDRAAVIMSTAILEQALEDAIATHFFALEPEEIQK